MKNMVIFYELLKVEFLLYRFGKGVILDMRVADVFEECATRFDEVNEDLMKCIMDKSILQEEMLVYDLIVIYISSIL